MPFKPLMIRTVPVVPKGKFLDVGCGAGNFLVQIKSCGMELYGVEPGDFDKKFAKKQGLNIFHGTLEQAKYPENYFDVITLNHVFEHLHNPKETLRELRRILKPGGTLVIAVPQRKCPDYFIFGKYWQPIDIPRHIIVPTAKNMKSYAKGAGFKLKKMKYTGSPSQFLASLLYWTNNFRKNPIYAADTNFMNNSLLFVLLMPYALLCNFLRIGDQVEVILTK
jgi:ubiquinone/menaquinone biosynthesis C-methylase UbiE